jgi:hypothetical protein
MNKVEMAFSIACALLVALFGIYLLTSDVTQIGPN